MTGAPLLTVHEVAARFRCNPETVRVMARRGDIASIRIGRGNRAGYRFTEAAIADYLTRQTTKVRRYPD